MKLPALRSLLALSFVTASAALSVACESIPTGAGVYLLTVTDAKSGKPVDGLSLTATGAGTRATGGKPSTAVTDEDGQATLAFGNWGAVDLVVKSDAVSERWLVTQKRVGVNGGTSRTDPLRLIVGAGPQGGFTIYGLSITRIEKGAARDNTN